MLIDQTQEVWYNSRSMKAEHLVEPTESDVAEAVVEALSRGLEKRLISVVLFGSRARGDSSAASDWDLLVIAQDLPVRLFARRLYLKGMLPASCRGAISILARTPDEFRAQLPSLYLDIALDGRILYDSGGYVAGELAELRELMLQVGLYREKTPAGDMWRWQGEPSTDWRQRWYQ